MDVLTEIAATGAAYTFAENVSANIREKEDGWNKFNGGAVAGAIIGATCKLILFFSSYKRANVF